MRKVNGPNKILSHLLDKNVKNSQIRDQNVNKSLKNEQSISVLKKKRKKKNHFICPRKKILDLDS